MNQNEIRQLATRYLGHLLTNTDARSEYMAIDKSDPSAIANLMQKHLQLASPPTPGEVQQMLQHSEELVKPMLDAMKQHAPEYYEMMLSGITIGAFNK
ncbi:MAG TPA: hypothetical protein VNJ51_10620 [Candidatus Dormibacteraeota bacterium]|nr:hypothetical protein [Candidatus Dormibacteraeota bacterium]